jgi:hypothetical protein
MIAGVRSGVIRWALASVVLEDASARRARDFSEKLVSTDASKRAPTTAPVTVLHVNACRAFKVIFFCLPSASPGWRAIRAALKDSSPST